MATATHRLAASLDARSPSAATTASGDERVPPRGHKNGALMACARRPRRRGGSSGRAVRAARPPTSSSARSGAARLRRRRRRAERSALRIDAEASPRARRVTAAAPLARPARDVGASANVGMPRHEPHAGLVAHPVGVRATREERRRRRVPLRDAARSRENDGADGHRSVTHVGVSADQRRRSDRSAKRTTPTPVGARAACTRRRSLCTGVFLEHNARVVLHRAVHIVVAGEMVNVPRAEPRGVEDGGCGGRRARTRTQMMTRTTTSARGR